MKYLLPIGLSVALSGCVNDIYQLAGKPLGHAEGMNRRGAIAP